MPRFRLDIEYDGGAYAGWQRQADQPSVQQAIEQAIARFCGDVVSLRGAGRTDAGVHAPGQVAHADLTKGWTGDKVRDAVNAHLQMQGERVSILKATPVPDTFDARFSALGRHYLYRILNRRAPAALEAGKVWWGPERPDAPALHEAAPVLVGRPDFTTLRSTPGPAAGPGRAPAPPGVGPAGGLIQSSASARSLLPNHGRSLVGSLKRVGDGAWTTADLKEALEARNRAACGQVAPPDGLFLTGVDYPEESIRE